MSITTLWIITIAMAVVTFATRISFIALWGRLRLPSELRAALRFVPAAVFAAIVAPAIAVVNGSLAVSTANPRLLAGLVALAVALRWRNEMLTISVGLITLALLTLVI
jgi:branched-subunit amino acid transport protein